jgi:hypothetical protein
MGLLVNLEPAPLRRLLKRGLREGLTPAGLEEALVDSFGADLEGPARYALLEALADRGWFLWNGQHWKTRLGASTLGRPPV